MLENKAEAETLRNYESMKEIWDLLSWEDRRFLYNLRGVDIINRKNEFAPNIGFSEGYALKRFPVSLINYSLLCSTNFILRIDRKDIAKDFIETHAENLEEDNEKLSFVYNKEMSILESTQEGKNMRIVATKEYLEFFNKFLTES